MTAIFISYNQAYYEDIINLFNDLGERGFTMWRDIMGRGTQSGEPHMGTHAWPTLNDAILSVVDDSNVDAILAELKKMDDKSPELGIRAFCWDVKKSI